MTKLLALFAAIVLPFTVAVAAEKSPTAPEYPGQPFINSALKDLKKAKDLVETNKADAIVFLEKAASSLKGSTKDKGNYRTSAIRWTKEAIKHLEASDIAKATHEIDEALDDVHKAGKIGAK